LGKLEGGVSTEGLWGPRCKGCEIDELSLLVKWKWSLLQGENSLWKEILVERYDHKVGDLLEGGVGMWPNNASNGGRIWCP